MIKDKEIEELFSSAIMGFDDNSIFTSELSRKLDKVEHLKRIQDEQKRGYRTDVILAFVSGVTGVLAALALLPLLPADIQIVNRILTADFNLAFPADSKLLSMLFIIAFSYALIFSIHSIRKSMRASRDVNTL